MDNLLGIVCAEVDKMNFTVKLAGFWRVRHAIRCITVDYVKCYNRDIDKILRNH